MSRRTRRPSTVLAVAAVAALLLTGGGAVAAQAAPGTWLSRINSYRASYGRARLIEDHQASRVAQRWSQTMAATGRLAHNPAYRTQVTTPYVRIGENVGYAGSEATLFRTFVVSPVHRQNLVSPGYNRVGIGQHVAYGRTWVTLLFLGTR